MDSNETRGPDEPQTTEVTETAYNPEIVEANVSGEPLPGEASSAEPRTTKGEQRTEQSKTRE